MMLHYNHPYVTIISATPVDHNPGPAMAALMKLSFDEEHRSAICQLGQYFTNLYIVNNFISTQKSVFDVI